MYLVDDPGVLEQSRTAFDLESPRGDGGIRRL